ncbi:extracellular solute-binding protein [Pseudolysinimonas kribbensis]|uniref:Sugar ABC transporter substrate-binding protein n=1 Tax=Pseudolysinimonas kribbensis TaxID=433641 RepID=A0ABQ6K7W8_9MICO|nr:ABC transporter substrate-binding protein [Pseudolysinimonas kribbensis]GMA95628.1 sugar ABC transporter substrate-binding protein [Pseudolysinimonas kribbensis]
MSFRAISKRTVRTAAALAVAGLLAAGLAACSGSSGSQGSAQKGDLTWWGWTPDQAVAENAITEFNKKYPDIHITFKKIQDATYAAALRPALASSHGPDVFNLLVGGTGATVKTYGVDAVDLTPSMKKLRGADWKNGLFATGVKDFTVGGQLKAAPIGKVAAGMMWINLDLFNQFGLKPPKTLDEWKSVCKTFREHNVGCFREGVDPAGFEQDTLHTIANSVQPGFYEKAIAGKAKWSDPAMVQTLTIWKNLQSDGILDPGALGIQQYPDVNNAFLSGQVAMVQMGTWYRQYTRTDTLKAALQGAGVSDTSKMITMVPIPFPDVAGKGHTIAAFSDPDYALAVNKKSKHIAAAETFATWLGATKAGQQVIANNLDEDPVLAGITPDYGKVPLVNTKEQTPYLDWLSKYTSNVTEARLANISGTLDQALLDSASTTLGAKATPEQAAQTLQSQSGQ